MTVDTMNNVGRKRLFSEIRLISVVSVDIVEVVLADSNTVFFTDRHAYLFDTSIKTIPEDLYNKHNICVVLPQSTINGINRNFECDVVIYDDCEYSCSDIYTAMQTALSEERFINEFKLNVSSLFSNGADIDSLASYSYDKLHYPVAVLDSSANLLYGKGFDTIQDDPIVSCLISDGMVSHELFMKYNYPELHKRLNRSINPFVDKPAGLRPRLRFRVVNGHNLIGQIAFMALSDTDFSQVDSECLKTLASVISMKIQASSSEYQLVSREALLHDLITGQLKESGKLSKYDIGRKDFATGNEYYIVVIAPSDSSSAHRDNAGSEIAMQRVHFSEWFPEVRFVCQLDGHLVALTGKAFWAKSENLIKEFIRTYGLRGAVSNLLSDVFTAQIYYEQCTEMLNLASDKKPVCVDADLLIFHQCYSWLLMEKAKKKIPSHAYVLPEWALLIDYDHNYKTQYVATLSAYLHNDTIISAANSLFIHKNTFLYRMEKIQNIIGHQITAEDRYNLYLSELLLGD